MTRRIIKRPGGSTSSNPGGDGGSRDKPNGPFKGWSVISARANRRYLQSVNFAAMLSRGYVMLSASLTVRDVPQDAPAFKLVMNLFVKDLQRQALVAYHWVLEWQLRGAPHLHLILVFESEYAEWSRKQQAGMYAEVVEECWLSHTRHWGTSEYGQHVVGMDNARGWAQYLTKHASRSVKAAEKAILEEEEGTKLDQRDSDNMPESWKGKSGRVWGKGGAAWILEEEEDWVSDEEHLDFQRMVRGWEVARVRKRIELAAFYRDLSIKEKTYERFERRFQANKKGLTRRRRAGCVNVKSKLFKDRLEKHKGNRAEAHRECQWLRGGTTDLPDAALRAWIKWYRDTDHLRFLNSHLVTSTL